MYSFILLFSRIYLRNEVKRNISDFNCHKNTKTVKAMMYIIIKNIE